MRNKAIVLIAVRLNTKRLKKKALLNLYDKPLISSLTDRLKQSKLVSKVVWCTSKEQVDDKLEILAKKTKVKIFRGPSKDVMLRFILAAQKYKAKTVVRVTGDNPLTDPETIDFLIKKHQESQSDYTVCNSIPYGTRAEVISLKALKKCHKILVDPNSSEYMTWMLYKPKFFKVVDTISPNPKINRPEISLTVDYKTDHNNLKKIYKNFKGKVPRLELVIKWIDKNKSLLKSLTRKRIAKRPKGINTNFKVN